MPVRLFLNTLKFMSIIPDQIKKIEREALIKTHLLQTEPFQRV